MNVSASTVKVVFVIDALTAGNTIHHGCNILFSQCVEVSVNLERPVWHVDKHVSWKVTLVGSSV